MSEIHKTDSAIEKRERQKEYIGRCVISVAFFPCVREIDPVCTQDKRNKVIHQDYLAGVRKNV